MEQFLWLGSLLGAVIGVSHAVHLYRRRAARRLTLAPATPGTSGFSYGIWAFALWTLFGAYVLAFWVLGALGLGISRLLAARRGT